MTAKRGTASASPRAAMEVNAVLPEIVKAETKMQGPL
jgi:hypothetical protein